jgi:hypothetical protein
MAITTRVVIHKKIEVDQVFAGSEDQVVLVGFLGSTNDRRDGQINNASLAYIHEHGSPAANIPPRPFLGPGVERSVGQIRAALVAGAQKFLGGDRGAINQSLNQAGLIAQGAVQQYMVSGNFAPLQAATIRRKGSSKPLIDTGQLRQAVTYQVKPRSGVRW